MALRAPGARLYAAVVLVADEDPRAGSHALRGRGGLGGGDLLGQLGQELLGITANLKFEPPAIAQARGPEPRPAGSVSGKATHRRLTLAG